MPNIACLTLKNSKTTLEFNFIQGTNARFCSSFTYYFVFRSSPLYRLGIAWFRSSPAERKRAFSLRCRTIVYCTPRAKAGFCTPRKKFKVSKFSTLYKAQTPVFARGSYTILLGSRAKAIFHV